MRYSKGFDDVQVTVTKPQSKRLLIFKLIHQFPFPTLIAPLCRLCVLLINIEIFLGVDRASAFYNGAELRKCNPARPFFQTWIDQKMLIVPQVPTKGFPKTFQASAFGFNFESALFIIKTLAQGLILSPAYNLNLLESGILVK